MSKKTKLTQFQIDEMVKLRKNGITYPEIGRQFGVTKTCVRDNIKDLVGDVKMKKYARLSVSDYIWWKEPSEGKETYDKQINFLKSKMK